MHKCGGGSKTFTGCATQVTFFNNSALCNHYQTLSELKCYHHSQFWSVAHNSPQMNANEARTLLGFAPNSRPTLAQVKSAYKKKVWESHPDLFPSHEKQLAESKFKLISEAYACLLPGRRGEASSSAEYSWVVRTGVPRANGGRKNHTMIKVPFILLILGTVALGGFNASRAYKKQKDEYPSHNPFLP